VPHVLQRVDRGERLYEGDAEVEPPFVHGKGRRRSRRGQRAGIGVGRGTGFSGNGFRQRGQGRFAWPRAWPDRGERRRSQRSRRLWAPPHRLHRRRQRRQQRSCGSWPLPDRRKRFRQRPECGFGGPRPAPNRDQRFGQRRRRRSGRTRPRPRRVQRPGSRRYQRSRGARATVYSPLDQRLAWQSGFFGSERFSPPFKSVTPVSSRAAARLRRKGRVADETYKKA
jgi:hypothetical protein